MDTKSLMPSPAQTKILVWEAFQELERRDRVKLAKPHFAIGKIVEATRQEQADTMISLDDSGRLEYFMKKINTLPTADAQELVRLCRLLKSKGRMINEEDFINSMMVSLRASGIIGIEKIIELLKLILPGKNPQTIVEDMYTLIRTSSNGAINVLNPQGNTREASYMLSSDIPDESRRPMVILLSGSATVRLSRKGTTLIIESTESVRGVSTPRKIIKNFPLTQDASITIGRDFALVDPLGLKTKPMTICDWGTLDQSVSRAALNIQIASGRIYIFDLHSANGATIEL